MYKRQDLYRMTKLNVVNEAIEYIPKKTKEGNPVTVRVPLNDKAKEILERYKDCLLYTSSGMLYCTSYIFPFCM